jgi:hypothetical protein
MRAMPAEYKTSERAGVFEGAGDGRRFIVHDGAAYPVAIDANGAIRVTDPVASRQTSFYVVPTADGNWMFGDWAGLKGGGFGDPPDQNSINGRVHGLEDHRRTLMRNLDQAAAREVELGRQIRELRSRQDEVSRGMVELSSRLSSFGAQLAGRKTDGLDEQQIRSRSEQVQRELAQLSQRHGQLAADRLGIERELTNMQPELVRMRGRVEDIDRELLQLNEHLRQNP